MQSLILASTLMLLGFQTFIVGLEADIISANRKILEDVQYHVRKLDYDKDAENKRKEDGSGSQPEKQVVSGKKKKHGK